MYFYKIKKMFPKNFGFVLLVFIIIFSMACKSLVFYKRGEKYFSIKDWDNSVKYLVKALDKDPDNIDYRLLLGKALISASYYHYNRGEDYFKNKMYKTALIEYEKSLENNPENIQAVFKKKQVLKKINELKKKEIDDKRLKKLEVESNEKSDNKLDPKILAKPYKLKFSDIDLKVLFKTLSNATGVRFLFHPGFKTKKIYVKEENASILGVLDRIMLQTGLFYKIIDSKTIFIIPDKPANRKKYDELVMRTFFINDGDPADISKIVRTMTGIKQVIINKELNALIIKSTIDKVRLAESIILTNDKPKGEVLIDIEIIEVNKTRINEYGIDLSIYSITQSYLPNVTDKGKAIVSLNDLKYSDATDYILNLPSINYKLLKSDRNSKIKAKPHIRAIDGEKIELKVGDKVPIPTTSFVPQYGGSQVNNQPITSFQLQDIGISIDLTPKIHYDGWVTIEMKFELTFISSPGDPTKNTPPTIGNRSVKSIIRLKDNETAIMAGLLRDTERKSVKSIPILSEIPILKSLFSGNSKEIEQTDIILTITPRIIRYPEINKSDLKYTWVGTALNPELKDSAPPKFYTEIKKKLKEKNKYDKINQRTNNKQKTNLEIDKSVKDQSSVLKVANKNNNKIKITREKDNKKKKDNLIKSEILFKKKESSYEVILKGVRNIKVLQVELSFDPKHINLTGIKRSLFLKNNNIKNLLFKRFDNKKGNIIINITFEKPIDMENKKILNLFFNKLTKGDLKIKLEKAVLSDKNSKYIDMNYKIE